MGCPWPHTYSLIFFLWRMELLNHAMNMAQNLQFVSRNLFVLDKVFLLVSNVKQNSFYHFIF